MKNKITTGSTFPPLEILPKVGCTGISTTALDGSYLQARTVEGSDMDLPGQIVVIPRGQQLQSFTPTDADGMRFTSKFGAVGLAVVRREFIVEGINERGLSCGLFFFPQYGSYEEFTAANRQRTIGDLQLNQWMLTQFSSVKEVLTVLKSGNIHIVGLDNKAAVHWRVGDATGRQVVIEIIHGKLHIHENTVSVITNAPDFQWHLTNLNNYVNLFPGNATPHSLGEQRLQPMGGNSGFLGIPGDATSPSRFVRAAFYCATAPKCLDAIAAIKQCFHILNNFDIPIGIEHPLGKAPNIPSATHWTSVINLTSKIVYFKTAYNNTIRYIDLNKIDFATVPYYTTPMDKTKEQPMKEILIPSCCE